MTTMVEAAPVRVADLLLGEWRLRVSGHVDLVAGVLATMTPPCVVAAAGPDADWTVRAERDERVEIPGEAAAAALFADRPVLASPCDGPQLAVVDAADGLLRLLGRYRPGTPAALLEVDRTRRMTRVVVPGMGPGRHWPDWVARLYFSCRLLDSGWRMLHASAVVVDEVAVLFVAGQGGGKSTLAHRACTELNARFMADDLVLVGPDGIVAGWPTRAALPAELAAPGEAQGRPLLVKGTRQRILFTPAEHRAVFVYAPPTRLGAVVHVTAAAKPGQGAHRPAAWAAPLNPADLTAVVAEAMNIPGQRLYSTDLLCLTGGPPSARVGWPDLNWGSTLGAPGVRLAVSDPLALPDAPVWEALSVWLPGVKLR
ncbi:hypothetical protein SAMN05216275_11997 [Streptosporangium canum]|uniref:HprK-related kinase B n=1 Tax=Streptosporangium canum TaxID=324952 RepID=A0A1I3XKV6_9ACTN|nr:hypothetical protein [Streptosporangium canum]SFK19999.1 hypothetical protein SAMN05216275_11997 [Streptosporangium canum]